jgi:hypothetical protein
LLLGVVRVDPRWESGDGTQPAIDQNSLFLYARDPAWRILRRIAHGVKEPVLHPSLVISGNRLVLSWFVQTETGAEARALLDPLDASLDQTLVLDSRFAGHPPVRSISLPAGRHVWVTRHLGSGAPSAQLRFSGVSGNEAFSIGHIDSPFLGGFEAAPVPPSDVLLAGAHVEYADPERREVNRVVSLLIRVRVVCRPVSTRP